MRFDLSSKDQANSRLSLALGLALSLALGLAAVTSISPAKADDRSFQLAALETGDAVETGPALNLDLSFLSRETDVWQSKGADRSPARHDQFESCYAAAEAAYQAGAWQGGLGSDTDGASAFENAVSGFYADQRRQSRQGDC